MGNQSSLYPLPCKIPVQLMGSHGGSLQTTQVGKNGAFIVTKDPPPVDELVTVIFSVPDEGSLEALAYVESESEMGVGIIFFSMDRPTRASWDRFVCRLAEQGKPSESGRSPRSGNCTDAERPRSEAQERHKAQTQRRPIARQRVQLDVHFRDGKELIRFIKNEVVQGTVTVDTDQELPVGTSVSLSIFHPLTKEAFCLDGVVRRLLFDEYDSLAGLLVALEPTTGVQKKELFSFSIIGRR